MSVGRHTLSSPSFFKIYFPAQSVSNDDRGNPSHLFSSLLSSGRTDGVFRPRVGDDPFLKGELVVVATANVPQPV